MKKLFLILFFFNQIAYSQSEFSLVKYDPNKKYTQNFLDSLGYDNASGELKARVSKSAFKKVLENNPNLKGWIFYYGGMSRILLNERKLDSSIYFANKGISHYNSLEFKRNIDEQLTLQCYRTRGNAFDLQGKFDKALSDYYKAISLSKKYPYKWEGFLITSVASIHLKLGNDSVALGYYRDVTRDYLYMSNPTRSIGIYGNIGVILDANKDHDSAIKYYKKISKIAIKQERQKVLGTIYGNLGVSYLYKGIQDSTLYYFEKSLEGEFKDDRNGKDYRLLYKAYIQISKDQSSEAIQSLEDLISRYSTKTNLDKDDLNMITLAYRFLISAHNDSLGTGEMANIFDRAIEYNNNFYKNLLDQEVDKLEVQFQSKEKDASILQLKREKKDQELILTQRSIINWSLAGVLFLIISFSVVLSKQRIQKNKLKTANLEQRLLRSQLNPHFIFNALNTASSLAHEKSNKTVNYISSLGTLLRGILENSREEFISLREEIETLSNYLELQSNFSSKFTFQIDVENEIYDLDETLLPPMFVQPFIENAVVHGLQGLEKDYLKVSFVISENALSCTIIDNGCGYSKSINTKDLSTPRSLSGQILKERLALYAKRFKAKAYFSILDRSIKEGGGTRVMLVLPLIRDV